MSHVLGQIWILLTGNTWLGKDVPLYLSLFLDHKYHVGSDPLTDLVPGHVLQEPQDGHLLEVMCLDTKDTSNFSFHIHLIIYHCVTQNSEWLKKKDCMEKIKAVIK